VRGSSTVILPSGMSKTNYTYVTGEVERCEKESLTCAVCHDPLQNAVMHTLCGHMFCALCVQPLANCPLCRGEFTNAMTAILPRMVTSKLYSLRVICGNCSKETERGALADHVQRCPICPFSLSFLFHLI
jgi:hypothetical protein